MAAALLGWGSGHKTGGGRGAATGREQHRPRTHAGKQQLEESLRFERTMFEDALQRSFSDNGSGNGTITLQGVHAWSDVADDPDHKVLHSNWDRLPHILLAMTVLGDRKAQLDHYDATVRSSLADMQTAAWNFGGPSQATRST